MKKLILMVSLLTLSMNQSFAGSEGCLKNYKKKLKNVEIANGAKIAGLTVLAVGTIVAAPFSVIALVPASVGAGGIIWGTIGGFAIGIGGNIAGGNAIENKFTKKVSRLVPIIGLLEKDQWISAEEIRLLVESRYLVKYNILLKQQLVATNNARRLGNLPLISIDELTREMPAEIPFPFEKRNLSVDEINEASLVDVVAGIKGQNLKTAEEYESFRAKLMTYLETDEQYCANRKHLYNLKEIANNIF